MKSILTITAAGFICALLGGVLGGLLSTRFSTSKQTIDLINVKRINVVEDDGSYALVIANSQKMPGVIRNGKEGARDRRNNVGRILYYNAKGDEVGGLITNVIETEERRDGGVQISMDQLNDQGQTLSLMHWMNDEYVRTALRIWDLPTDKPASTMNTNLRVKNVRDRLSAAQSDEEIMQIDKEYRRILGEEKLWAERIYLGSEGAASRVAMLEIKDSKSQPRIQLAVDENDQPIIEILDEQGKVLQSWNRLTPP